MALPSINMFYTMIKNRKSYKLNRELIGYSLTKEFAPIKMKDIQAYVEATGDDPTLYMSESDPVPQFYMSSLLYYMFEHMMTLPKLKVNIIKMVHAFQEAKWSRLVYPGEAIQVTMDIMDISDTTAGEMLHLRTKVYVNGEESFEAITGFLVKKNNKENKRKSKKIVKDNSLEPFITKKIQTFEGQQLLYAKVSHDKNFIHTNEYLARIAGLKRTILQGICVASMTINALRDSVNSGDVNKMRGFSLRFSKPVYPGEELLMYVYHGKNDEEVLFEVKNEKGKNVIKNGIFTFYK